MMLSWIITTRSPQAGDGTDQTYVLPATASGNMSWNGVIAKLPALAICFLVPQSAVYCSSPRDYLYLLPVIVMTSRRMRFSSTDKFDDTFQQTLDKYAAAFDSMHLGKPREFEKKQLIRRTWSIGFRNT